jgi:hypothetical protein
MSGIDTDIDVDGDDSVDDNLGWMIVPFYIPISSRLTVAIQGHISSGYIDRSKGSKEWVPVNYNF